jgi:hypothetical protein
MAPGVPYAPLSTAVEQLLAGARGTLDGLPDRTRSVLAELTPLAAARAGAARRADPPPGRRRLRRALWPISPAPPTLLLVEDAHLCDAATADVLHQLLAGGAGGRCSCCSPNAPFRPGVGPAGPMAPVAAQAGAARLDLGPLPAPEIDALVALAAADPLAPDARERIGRMAGGSPFFAMELARAASTSRSPTLPASLREAILDRVVDLDGDTVARLARLAVAPGELDLPSVVALSGLDEPDAFDLLDAGLAAGVLVVSGTRYRFRHELVRRALTDDLPPHRRVALHRDAARRLVDAGGAPELIAAHWLDGLRPREAVPWLLAAARRAAALGAFADARGHLERLLDAQPGHHEALALRAETLDALGDSRAPARTRRGRSGRRAGRPRSCAPARRSPSSRRAIPAARCGRSRARGPGRPRACSRRRSRSAPPRRSAGTPTPGPRREGRRRPTSSPSASTTRARSSTPRGRRRSPPTPWGELPARLRQYLRSTHELPELATRSSTASSASPSACCFGGLPNEEIIAFAGALGRRGRAPRRGARAGVRPHPARRGGDPCGAPGRGRPRPRRGARLHGRIGAVAGEALSLLGRAQVATYRGRPEQARPWLADALLMARESEVGHHTLDRIYGAMVEAAADPAQGVVLVREAEAAIVGPAETCPTCRIAFVVPAAIAAARAGDVERARRYARTPRPRSPSSRCRRPGAPRSARFPRVVAGWRARRSAAARETSARPQRASRLGTRPPGLPARCVSLAGQV